MLEVQKKGNEGNEGVVRRFSRKVQASGVLIQARKIRFHTKKKSRRKQREEAQRRVELQTERERLIKLGEIDEFALPTTRQRGPHR